MKNLKGKVYTGIKYSLIEKGVLFLLGLIQLAIVVRYIGKGDLGLMAIANTILAFTFMFSELGIGNSLLYEQSTDREQLSSIFWWQVLFSLFIYCILVFSALPVAWFYNAPILKPIIYILGSTVVIGSFGQTYNALLYRDLHFVTLSLIKVAVNVVSFLTIVLLAIWGFGIWSLVVGALSKTAVQTILLIRYGQRSFKPKFRLSLRKILPHIHFGLFQTGERIVNLINSQIDVLIIGKLLGEEILGVYDIIKQLLSKIFRAVNSILASVLLPVFAKLQKDVRRVSKLYLEQLNITASINFPIYLLVAFNAVALFTIVLNPEWLTPINQQLVIYFSIYFLMSSIQNPLGTIIISQGLVKQSFFYNLSVSLVLFPLLFWSASIGILEVLQVLIATQFLRIWFSYYYLLKPVVVFNFSSFLKELFPPLTISIVSILLAYHLSHWFALPLLITIMTEGTLFLIFYIALMAQWNVRFYQQIQQFIQTVFKQ